MKLSSSREKTSPSRRWRRSVGGIIQRPSAKDPGPVWLVRLLVFFLAGLLSFGNKKRLGGGLGLLALGLLGLVAAGLHAGEDGLTVLVELELGDDDVAGVDAQGDALAGGLVTGDALDVDDVFEAVDRGDLALLVLVGAADDGDLVVLADGDGADLWRRG